MDDSDDIWKYESDTTYVYHARYPALVSRTIQVGSDKTYYVLIDHSLEGYVSPAGYGHVEYYDYFWYYTKLDPWGNEDDPFYVMDDGSEGNMFVFEKLVRIEPPTAPGAHRFVLYAVVRDYRWEWRMY
ncbi:MAG: hypothetical protein KAY24_08265, partial [Candidatus Eisenbacteria sp.]|nr:hypothetical protein [Candidatus Eisenbacteria bacterium]